jgi:hypothetical protein
MAQRLFLSSWPILSAALLLACGDDAAPGSPAPGGGCEPGESYPCACSTGQDSTQVCNEDGTSLSPCACDAPHEGPTGAGGVPGATGGSATGGASAGTSPGGSTASGGGEAGGAGGGATGGQAGAGGSPTQTALPDGVPHSTSCTGMGLPATTDYGALGPFTTVRIDDTGPGGQYTMFRPESPGGANGFLHPPITWGNGIFTTPNAYVALLTTFASHGFVVIASNSTNVNASLMTAGLDWLLAQNTAGGELHGKLATDCAATVGYSLGGGAAIGSGTHPSVVTTVSFHGLQGAAESLHGPLFLLTSTTDGFVTKEGYTVPTYNRSTVVPTLMATLEVPGEPPSNEGHLIPLNDAGEERAPAVAWLRYWVYDDQGARHYFFGNDCVLCQTPWVDLRRKNYDWN